MTAMHNNNTREASANGPAGGLDNQAAASGPGYGPGTGPMSPPLPSLPPPSPPPPRGPHFGCLAAALAFGLLALVAGMVWSVQLRQGFDALYGRVTAHGTDGHAGSAEPSPDSQPHYYTCGMHPWVILPKPGDCPICHMKLVPLDPSKFTNEVVISPIMVQDIGVRVTAVVTGPVSRIIRTVGTVDYNETLVRDVNLKIGGWVEKLHVNYVGQPVRAGDPLLDIYSPELYTAQAEYLQAYKLSRAPQAAPPPRDLLPGAARWDADLLSAARTRLENFDISPAQIAELERSGQAARTMAIRSPFDGLVVVKNVYEGVKVEPGMPLLRIADLSKVWVMVAVYEYQMPYIQLGQSAVVTLPYIPGQTFEGRVTYIYPYVSTEVRQIKLRLEFDNPNLLLKPGMFANVELRSTLARDRVLVPREAVIDTGLRQVTFVSLGAGRFDPRLVKLGAEAENGMVEILDGLKPGEMVVTSGQFLLDSESRLREALAKMVKGTPAAEQRSPAAPGGTSELSSLPAPAAKALGQALDSYFTVSDALSRDSLAGLPPAARSLAAATDDLVKVEIPGQPHFWHNHAEVAQVRAKALELVDAKKIEEARQKFADLSVALSKLLRATGVPPSYDKMVEELHCPMYRENQGGIVWLQPAGEVRNPYFGKVMPSCFDRRVTMPVTGAKLPAEATAAPDAQSNVPAPATTATATSVPAPSPPPSQSPSQPHLDRLVSDYLAIQKLLATDQTDGAAERLAAIRQSSAALAQAGPEPVKPLAERVAKAVETAASKVARIDDLRLAFKELSDAMIALVKAAPPSTRVAPAIFQLHCPMANSDWLQDAEKVANPYYGSSMLSCGSVTATVKSVAPQE